MDDLTAEQLREAITFFFSRRFGVSSAGMFREALGLPQERSWFAARPYDRHDSQGAEETYAAAPDWLQERMLPRLEWYREIAAAGWPSEFPERIVSGAPE
jgi:hypothetical protein